MPAGGLQPAHLRGTCSPSWVGDGRRRSDRGRSRGRGPTLRRWRLPTPHNARGLQLRLCGTNQPARLCDREKRQGGKGTRARDAKSFSGRPPLKAAACLSMLDLLIIGHVHTRDRRHSTHRPTVQQHGTDDDGCPGTAAAALSSAAAAVAAAVLRWCSLRCACLLHLQFSRSDQHCHWRLGTIKKTGLWQRSTFLRSGPRPDRSSLFSQPFFALTAVAVRRCRTCLIKPVTVGTASALHGGRSPGRKQGCGSHPTCRIRIPIFQTTPETDPYSYSTSEPGERAHVHTGYFTPPW